MIAVAQVIAKEIERKWLIPLESLPELSTLLSKEILQGYISTGEPEVRLRKSGSEFFQTIKFGEGLIRDEIEIPLTAEQFITLWPATADKRIEKTRYELEYQGLVIEIDIYSGKLAGLIVAEVEFPNELAAGDFVLPKWFGQDVTDDKRFKNKNLSQLAGLETLS